MGSMQFRGIRVEFDDVVLAHLQIVIMRRLRSGAGVQLSWRNAAGDGDGRSSVWISPVETVFFRFAGSRPPAIDRAWLDRLIASAESGTGLVVADTDNKLLRPQHQEHARW